MMADLNPIAFSTVACPDWKIERVLEAANEYGYQGIELRTMGGDASSLASEPDGASAAGIRRQFRDAGVDLICLSTGVALHYKKEFERHQAMNTARHCIDLAAELGAPQVRMFGYQIYPGELKAPALRRLCDRFTSIAEYAEQSGIEILIENAGTFARSKELWGLMQEIDHPLVNVCWNVANGATVGESPLTSVSVLHSRIRLAKVKDTEIGDGSGFVPLGEGNVGVERFIEILRGIGYDGYISVEWDKAWLPSLAEPEEYLPQAIATLQEWMRLKVDKKGKPLSRLEAPVLEVKAEA